MPYSSISNPPNLNKSISSLQSQVVDLDGVSSFSVQANYVNDAPAVKTFKSLTQEVQTITCAALADTTDRDYVIVYNAAGTSYAVYADKTGTSIAPTGALYLAASYKASADISGATSATDVALIFDTAFNTLTGFTASILSVPGATIVMTQVSQGPTTNPVVKNLDDSGAGSITGVETTAGVTSNIDITTDHITIATHPYVTGTKVALTTGGGLPTGLSATNYWVVRIDEDTIGLAATLILSAAGTLVNITAEGTGTHTLTAATSTTNVFKLQKSNDSSNWTDISSMTVTIATTAGTSLFEIVDPSYRYMRVLYTPSAGQVALTAIINQVKG